MADIVKSIKKYKYDSIRCELIKFDWRYIIMGIIQIIWIILKKKSVSSNENFRL